MTHKIITETDLTNLRNEIEETEKKLSKMRKDALIFEILCSSGKLMETIGKTGGRKVDPVREQKEYEDFEEQVRKICEGE